MDFLHKDLSIGRMSVIKLVGIVLFGLVVAAIVLSGLNSARNMGTLGVGTGGSYMAPSTPAMMDVGANYYSPTLSMRNMVSNTMPVPEQGYAPGDDSEAFEVKEYHATVETRDLDRDCGVIEALKAREDVIFENANASERNCTFTFKVKRGSVEAVLTVVKGLDPRDLSESVYTIKREVEDYTNEISILEQKLATLNATLAEATASYENITSLATTRGDVESLAKIIESKLTIIERLTNARLATANQLEVMSRAKAEALDRLEYTYFTVAVYKNEFVDGKSIKDSWKAAVQTFVRDTNRLLQDISIGIVNFILIILKLALYFIILLFVARYGWTFTQRVWKGSVSRSTEQTPQ